MQTSETTTCETFFLKNLTLIEGKALDVTDKRSAVLSISSLTGCSAGIGATCFISAIDHTGNCKEVCLTLSSFFSHSRLVIARRCVKH